MAGVDAPIAAEEQLPDARKMRRILSDQFHRRFPTVNDYVSELGGSKALVIEKVLIANNGVAAVKAIRSIRKWAYDTFGNERAISFVVMATPEDLRANAEYIRMGDVIADVPGGSNNHNYANVTLIVELARLHGVHAVWAGWGHASENPVLPDTLAQSNPPIKFIGPSGPPMRALGDKIGSTIIAQSAGVPCISWNGQDVVATYNKETGALPEAAYEEASIANVGDANAAAQRIGFPIMIKASEGGGGKGIRRVDKAEDVSTCYRQVCGEVPGSPIFIMKLSSNSRHLEVQLLADEYGDAVALNGRDCSVQRRHQKIIEEGPPIAATPDVWTQMEQAAVALAKAVGYANAGTVEYLFSESESKFYFLELNPRLQVEHPVTEMITRVNLPAAQLQVAMGIPLHNIPEIRALYGRNRFEEDPKCASVKIDFDKVARVPPYGHCIAVRITAENAEAGFKPTSGGIQELNFRSTPDVWGYFSMDSSGSIHEFADSQFGHLFASGTDREQARRNMVLALKELSIRGDISTTVDFISKLIELDDFVGNDIDTGWLDEIIKENVDGMGQAENGLKRRKSSINTSVLEDDTYVIIGAVVVSFDLCRENEQQFLELVEKGQPPPRSLLKMTHNVELILSGVKYKLSCTRKGPHTFSISVLGNEAEAVVTNVRVLSDGGYLIDIEGISHVAYLTSKRDAASGMRLNIAGTNVVFSADYDPSSLRTDVAGKLVKKLVTDGARVKKGQPYCEIEVMKMFMPLKVDETGIITWCANEGASISPGDLLANLELENPENVSSVSIFEGSLRTGERESLKQTRRVEKHPHLQLRRSFVNLNGAMDGYVLSTEDIDVAMNDLASSVTNPLLPVMEIEEPLAVLSGRIQGELFENISRLLNDFKKLIESQAGSGSHLRFPADGAMALLEVYEGGLEDPTELSGFSALSMPLRNAILPYTKSKGVGVPGAERALQGFLSILRKWIAVERWFCDCKSYADAIDGLRKKYKDDCQSILEICRAHEQLATTSDIVMRIISVIADGSRIDSRTSMSSPIGKRVSIVAGAESLPHAIPSISEIGAMGSDDSYHEVALRARKVVMQESIPSLEERRRKVLNAAEKLMGEENSAHETEVLLAEHMPIADVFFPLIKSLSSRREKMGMLELYTRFLYRTYTLQSVEKEEAGRIVKFSFLNKPSESVLSTSFSVTSLTHLSRIVSSSGSLNKMDEAQDDSSRGLIATENKEKIPTGILRTGLSVIIDNIGDLSDGTTFEALLAKYPTPKESAADAVGPVHVLYFVVLDTSVGVDEQSSNEIAASCEAVLDHQKAALKAGGVRRVSFVLNHETSDEFDEYCSPALFTYRYPDFVEDTLFRRIDPSHAFHLELNRVASNFHVRSLGSRHTSTCQIHLYEGTPKRDSVVRGRIVNRGPRVFVRALSFVLEFSSTSYERILVDALNALDLAPVKFKGNQQSKGNHLFINLVSEFEKSILDPVVVEQVVVDLLKRHSERVSRLGIIEVEMRIVCCLSQDSPPIALRLVASNPTGYVHVMNTYVEAASESGGDRVFKPIGGTKASLAGTGDSSWEGLDVNTPYPLMRPFDDKREAAHRASDTVYCYDLPALFEAAVEQQWLEVSERGGAEGRIRPSGRPLMVMYTTELVVQKKNRSPSESWTIQDYLNGDLELTQIHRGAGANDVGMVAWLMVLKTVEYPDGRQVILIANDITHKAGSFGTREDVVFKLASEFAREKRIPRLFVAANSGARIGLAESVKKSFKVAFKDAEKPENGFEFLYLTKEDFDQLGRDQKQVIAHPVSYAGQEVYRITDIIGSEPDLGVENLKGSGLIAGETSIAYDDIFTMTVVLGRTVGIGAYLVRLGQRTIQKASSSPIILTGYQALNKLMGVDVYSTNDQLGGPGIMYQNGVSHLVEPDHLRAVKAAIDWLSYVPSVRRGILPVTDIRGVDEIDRRIGFAPAAGIPYDPRHLLEGCEDEDGNWLSGFFDRGSFKESLAGWAKTVVVGRARLGGIPMGVVVTENRTMETVKPADPGDAKASEVVIHEAGCVWFPNSAFKTAQAIKDFHTEDLPLIIFANWRGFSGGQRDMFDEVLKYGSLIVDAFLAYEQPVFVFIPPFAEIRGGAWVVLDASINSSVMEMYASAGSARGGVLEANGAASVKYRYKDLIKTMHRLDETLICLDSRLGETEQEDEQEKIKEDISKREQILLPAYEQISVQFCELHDTPGRMSAVGVIEKEVEWGNARSFFYWRLRRKLAEFDLRRKLIEAAEVGRATKILTPSGATSLIKKWCVETSAITETQWSDDKLVLSWMAEHHKELEEKVNAYTKHCVVGEVVQVMTAGGNTAKIGTAGIVEGLSQVYEQMDDAARSELQEMISKALRLK